MRLVILTALWGRLELSRKVMAFHSQLNLGDVEVIGAAVGSEGDESRAAARESGFFYIEAPNEPLGAKWNAGLQFSRDFNPDAVMIIGSDDFIEAGLVNRLVRRIRGGADYAGLTDIYFLDSKTGGTGYFPGHSISVRGGDPVGAGRIFSRSLLTSAGWLLWEDDLPKGLDRASHRRIRCLGARPKMISCRREGLVAVDVKSDENIWSWRQVRKSLLESDLSAGQIQSRLGVELVEKRRFVRLPDGRVASIVSADADGDGVIIRPLGRSRDGGACPTEFASLSSLREITTT